MSPQPEVLPVVAFSSDHGGDLQFAKNNFIVKTCAGAEKNFASLSTWELLNLKPETVLDLPKMLHDQYGVSPTFIEHALDKYNIQTTSKDKLEDAFQIRKPSRYLLTNTRHYSWPKGGGKAPPTVKFVVIYDTAN
jgi:hypothetical protein